MKKEKVSLAAAHLCRWGCTLSVIVHDEEGYSFASSGCSGMLVKRDPDADGENGGTFDQGWANLDQAHEDLDRNIFRDLSPTPKP